MQYDSVINIEILLLKNYFYSIFLHSQVRCTFISFVYIVLYLNRPIRIRANPARGDAQDFFNIRAITDLTVWIRYVLSQNLS